MGETGFFGAFRLNQNPWFYLGWVKNEMLGFTIRDDDIVVYSEHLGGPGSPVEKDGEVIGRVQKCVYSYVNEINNGYIFVKKGSVLPGDKVTIHGHEALVCQPKFL